MSNLGERFLARPMPVAHTRSAAQTRALATGVAALLQAGDLLVLAGDLGAGKTTFTQGLGAGLGVQGPVTSPTFTLHRQYLGADLVLNHLDVYRIGRRQDADDLDLSGLLESGGVTVVEWGDLLVPELPADYLRLRLVLGTTDDERTLFFEAVGARWQAREQSLRDLIRNVANDEGQPC